MTQRWPRLREAFFGNVTLKLLSLGLALVLFLFVRGDKETVVGVTVNVVTEADPKRVLVSGPIDRVKVTLRGKWSKLRGFMGEPVEPIRLNLANIPQGEHFFDTSLLALPPGVRIVALQPASLNLRFEPRVSREVEVEPVIVGAHDAAFIMTERVVEPSHVRVSGAKSHVLALKRVRTTPVDVNRRWEDTVLELGLAPPGEHVAVDPPGARVQVRLRFEAREGERVLTGVPVKIVGATRYAVELKPAQATLRLEGPIKELRSLEPSGVLTYVEVEDLDNRPPGTYRRKLLVDNLPQGVELVRARPKVLHVTTRLAPPPADDEPEAAAAAAVPAPNRVLTTD